MKRYAFAEQINDIFRQHGLPEIPDGADDWMPILAANIGRLSKDKAVHNQAAQLQAIYNREVHFQITVVWDVGFEVSYGLEDWGPVDYFRCDTAQEALDWLCKKAGVVSNKISEGTVTVLRKDMESILYTGRGNFGSQTDYERHRDWVLQALGRLDPWAPSVPESPSEEII